MSASGIMKRWTFVPVRLSALQVGSMKSDSRHQALAPVRNTGGATSQSGRLLTRGDTRDRRQFARHSVTQCSGANWRRNLLRAPRHVHRTPMSSSRRSWRTDSLNYTTKRGLKLQQRAFKTVILVSVALLMHILKSCGASLRKCLRSYMPTVCNCSC